MKLQKLHIKNFKSIVDLEIVEPNPFTVFVGPNGSGKSNIFEALEFINFISNFSNKENSKEISALFGGPENYLNRNQSINDAYGEITIGPFKLKNDFKNLSEDVEEPEFYKGDEASKLVNALNKFHNFSRLFVNSPKELKLNFQGGNALNTKSSNLEKVLKRILQDEIKREEIKEWLDLFIPGFENIEIVSSELSGTDTLVMYEKGIKKPFTKDLLSDGTYNILALLTAVYQSDEPQFLCIEEPENGLHPQVIRELVYFFREACIQKGHYIWLNTHSQTLVAELKKEEVIAVNKIEGETRIKQFRDRKLYDLPMDEAWLTGVLNGGLIR
ncbi:AAA family ATPase [Runella aurantiaca]|uniref:Chromosome segregation protein SMC n=1 Tax=Runella aurantiaca TaxID=2282308 RepID=A0A369IE32_9BACT|nr:AAA family ATPase [Runella aurantiaca]RDB05494.1 chromosome segregation protein SMC [Runella aurantiaca]